MVHRPLRLTLDSDALVSNWHWLAHKGGGAACGAAVKANAYGLGARAVVKRLQDAGCRDFFVSTWAEVEALEPWPGDLALSVLHGAGPDDMAVAATRIARPVLNSPEQVRRWRETGRPCDVMVDTGMNRLGLAPADVAAGLLDGLRIETLMSHLACAEEDTDTNEAQRKGFREVAAKVKAKRLSLSNSAGVCLGPRFAFDLTRPGVALYGGIPRREAAPHIRQVARVEAQIIQRRRIGRGDRVGYGGTFLAERDHELAILNIGYADGYLRGFSNAGRAKAGDTPLPVVGRVSMDLTAISVDAAPDLKEGDWIELDYDLPEAAAQSGLSQYELLTTLGSRFARRWT
ncbi:alanine racemase [Sphingosinicella sp. LHD-64]|uniref:alanine racemase n=1 Tax=Sphingosinicella sp. LHD-64 TaxID=3072139 RepID=UPI00280FBD13|nr:alanine racemase [Sphingosinicella sp. LHD-64]MDQ8757272.1 alanine racemase [Sphingosinicella sp. LHD-64]